MASVHAWHQHTACSFCRGDFIVPGPEVSRRYRVYTACTYRIDSDDVSTTALRRNAESCEPRMQTTEPCMSVAVRNVCWIMILGFER